MKKILLPAILSLFLLTSCGGDEPAEAEKKEETAKKPPKKKGDKAAKNDKAALAAAEAASLARREAAELAQQQQGVLIIGDSYSAGEGLSSDQSWPGLLERRLAKSTPAIPVVNSSLSGDTASGGVSRIGWQLAKYKPRLIVLALGSRDFAQQADLALVQKDLATIIRTAKANRVDVLLVGAKAPTSVPVEYQIQVDAMFRNLAAQEKVSLVPDLMAPYNRIASVNPEFSKSLNANKEIQPALVDNLWPALYLAIKEAGFKTSLPAPPPVSATPPPAAPVAAPVAPPATAPAAEDKKEPAEKPSAP